MFAMGLGAAFSKRTTAAIYLSRAGSLFILGVIVNFFEQYIPAILVPDTLGPLNEVYHSILATDIYSFAALGSLYFALMKKLESRRSLQILSSVLLVGVCSCINIVVGPFAFTTDNV